MRVLMGHAFVMNNLPTRVGVPAGLLEGLIRLTAPIAVGQAGPLPPILVRLPESAERLEAEMGEDVNGRPVTQI
jgi:hypothetical protein